MPQLITYLGINMVNNKVSILCFLIFFLQFLINLFLLVEGYLLYTIVVVFAIHRHESATRAHVCPHPEPSTHLPPHLIPLLSQSTGFECPISCIELSLKKVVAMSQLITYLGVNIFNNKSSILKINKYFVKEQRFEDKSLYEDCPQFFHLLFYFSF